MGKNKVGLNFGLRASVYQVTFVTARDSACPGNRIADVIGAMRLRTARAATSTTTAYAGRSCKCKTARHVLVMLQVARCAMVVALALMMQWRKVFNRNLRLHGWR